MRITCIGGGPAGLYFAICAKRQDPAREITVVEADPPGATYGWGVGYWDSLLELLFANDSPSAGRIRAASEVWAGRQVLLPGAQPVDVGGHGYTINRSMLLGILNSRASELGVELKHGHSATEHATDVHADLIVASDGSNSPVRRRHEAEFGTRTRLGSNRYIWLGTEQHFSSMTFAFERTAAGWVWFYGYPSAPGVSTCVVECSEATWRSLGLDTEDHAAGLRSLESIFSRPLAGHALISQDRGQPARWHRYRDVTNERWSHNNTVLLGDAAHTVHFTMGSGTGLAMAGAAALAASLSARPTIAGALHRYERKRRTAVTATQAAGRQSMAWFEQVELHLQTEPAGVALALALANRYS